VINPPCSKVSSSTTSTTSLKRKKSSNNEHQLYLDFGQSSFGRRVTCGICNMVYVEGLIDDESNHSKLCKDYSLGVSYVGYWKRERVVYTDHINNHRIIE